MRAHAKGFTDSILPFLALLFFLTSCGSPPSEVATTSNATSTPSPQNKQSASITKSSKSQASTAALPLTRLRMIDQFNGWALTKSQILRTTDGGQHWKDVTMSGSGGNAIDAGSGALPVFQSASRAWIFVPTGRSGIGSNSVTIWRTSDGGQSWQRSVLTDPQAVDIADRPNFSDAQHGWILFAGPSAAGSEGADLYKTVDGGQTWTLAARAPGALQLTGRKTGPTFLSPQQGWISNYVGAMDNAPLLDYTTDGGKTWTEASLPTANGIDTASYETTPPICFEGQKKVVPVHVHLNGGSSALAMYIMGTNPGWTINVTKQFDTQDVYVVTTDHFWALDKATLYGTIDGAQHWTRLANLPTTAGEMSFISILDGWTADSNSPILYHTGDGGHTWNKITYSIQ